MKRALYLLCTALVLTALAGCNLLSGNIYHVWFYTYKEGALDAHDSALSPASFLEFRKDGTYTKDFGHFEYGEWQMDGNKLTLTDLTRHSTVYTVDLTRPKEMQLGFNSHYTASFEKMPLPDPKEGKDPFSLQNNLWRIPAVHKESNTEIRARLYIHCKFWETYFAWALAKEVEVIDVRSTPSLIKIYGNGMTLKPMADLNETWRSYFYDKEDCKKANIMIENIFRTEKINWTNTDNKYKMFMLAFQQMASYLK